MSFKHSHQVSQVRTLTLSYHILKTDLQNVGKKIPTIFRISKVTKYIMFYWNILTFFFFKNTVCYWFWSHNTILQCLWVNLIWNYKHTTWKENQSKKAKQHFKSWLIPPAPILMLFSLWGSRAIEFLKYNQSSKVITRVVLHLIQVILYNLNSEFLFLK